MGITSLKKHSKKFFLSNENIIKKYDELNMLLSRLTDIENSHFVNTLCSNGFRGEQKKVRNLKKPVCARK